MTDRFGWLRVLIYLFVLILGLMSLNAQAQTHTVPTLDRNNAWTGTNVFTSIDTSSANSWTQAQSFLSINGVQYADRPSGADACAKIAAAVTALPSQGGVVDARNFSGDQTCTSGTLTLGSTSKSVVLLLGNYRIISASTPVITVPGSSWIIGLNSKGGAGFSAINSTNSGGTVILWTGSNGGIRNLFLGSVGANGKGLYLQASGTTSVQYNEFSNIQINGQSLSGSNGVRYEANSATALVTHNIMSNVFAHDFAVNFLLTSSASTGPTDNTFINLNPQSFSTFGTGIEIAWGALNQFIGGIAEGLVTGISVDSGTAYNQFIGFRSESNTNELIDNGTGTMFIGHSIGANTISGTDATRTYIGTGNASTTQFIPSSTKINGVVQALSSAASNANNLFSDSLEPGTGWTPRASDHSISIALNGIYRYQIIPGALRAGANEVYQWSSNADPTLAVADVGLSRGAAGQVNCGNGTQGDASCTIAAAGVKIGGGDSILWFKKATHATLDLASVASGACTAATSETITGAALGDSCKVSSAIATADGSFYACNVTATDTVKWSYCNLSGGAIDRASDTYTIRVTR